jgi:hypothetical protein
MNETIKHKTLYDEGPYDKNGNVKDKDSSIKSGADIRLNNSDKEKRSKSISNLQAVLGLMSRTASVVQSCVLKGTAVQMKITDFANKQNRKILAKVVAYRKKSEDALMMEAMAELAEFEAD